MKLKLPCREKLVTISLLVCLAIVASALAAFAAVTHRTLKSLRTELYDVKHDAAVAAPMLSGNALYTLRTCGGKIGIYDAAAGFCLTLWTCWSRRCPSRIAWRSRAGSRSIAFPTLRRSSRIFPPDYRTTTLTLPSSAVSVPQSESEICTLQSASRT